MKRAATQLAAKPSPFHSGVTLFETASTPATQPNVSNHDNSSDEAGPSTDVVSPRRSKRFKLDTSTVIASNQTLPATRGTRTKSVVKEETVVDVEDLVPAPPRQCSPRKLARTKSSLTTPSSSPRKKIKAIPQALDVPHPAPPRWRETYDAVKTIRSRITAPVDTMGCDQAQTRETDGKARRFATLVSLMLSSQTKDEVTDAAVAKLRLAVGGALSVEAVVAAEESVVAEAINKVGFWRRKTDYIKRTAFILRDEYESDVPKTVDELCALPGVGPKMAFLALQIAWKLNAGIGVDVHVHRITNRLGWHKPPTKNPEETRLNLQSWLPLELHPEINHMLVGFGQTICQPVSPRCDLCTLPSMKLCPSARKVTTAKTRKAIIMTEASEGSITKLESNEVTLIKMDPDDECTTSLADEERVRDNAVQGEDIKPPIA